MTGLTSTWRDQFGFEPTRDPRLIREWAEAGHDLAIALHELPPDGPCHPATAWLGRSMAIVECEPTGRRLIVQADDYPAVAAIVAGWSCTYLVLRDAYEAGAA